MSRALCLGLGQLLTVTLCAGWTDGANSEHLPGARKSIFLEAWVEVIRAMAAGRAPPQEQVYALDLRRWPRSQGTPPSG